MGAGQHVHQAGGHDAAEHALRHRATQHAAHAAARGDATRGYLTARGGPASAQQPAEQARLLLLDLGRLLGEKVGVLQAVVYTVLVDVGEALALLAGGLDQGLPQLHALLRRQLGEDVLCRLLVDLGGKLRGDLLVAGRRLLPGYRLRALAVTVDEVLLVSRRVPERVVPLIHYLRPDPIYNLVERATPPSRSPNAAPQRTQCSVSYDTRSELWVHLWGQTGRAFGSVVRRDKDTQVGVQRITASENEPRYLVESEKSGKEAAHKPDVLNKV